MPRKRTKQVTEDTPIADETVVDEVKPVASAEPVQQAPDIFDEQIALRQQEKAAESAGFTTKSTSAPEAEPASKGFSARTHANGHIANPSSVRRPTHAEAVRKLPSTMTIMAGDLKVQMIDKGDNLAGIGIRVVVPEGRTLTEAEKNVIRSHTKGEDGEQTGYSWNRDVGMWHKAIVRPDEFEDQVPPSRPVAIRLECERRIAAIADDLRQLQADPASFAEMIKARREQAAEAGRIPD